VTYSPGDKPRLTGYDSGLIEKQTDFKSKPARLGISVSTAFLHLNLRGFYLDIRLEGLRSKEITAIAQLTGAATRVSDTEEH
jgi:hypothetical protein